MIARQPWYIYTYTDDKKHFFPHKIWRREKNTSEIWGTWWSFRRNICVFTFCLPFYSNEWSGGGDGSGSFFKFSQTISFGGNVFHVLISRSCGTLNGKDFLQIEIHRICHLFLEYPRKIPVANDVVFKKKTVQCYDDDAIQTKSRKTALLWVLFGVCACMGACVI